MIKDNGLRAISEAAYFATMEAIIRDDLGLEIERESGRNIHA